MVLLIGHAGEANGIRFVRSRYSSILERSMFITTKVSFIYWYPTRFDPYVACAVPYCAVGMPVIGVVDVTDTCTLS